MNSSLQNINRIWKQSGLFACARTCGTAWSGSRLALFLLGPGLAAHTGFFQGTVTYRILAGIGQVLASLIRQAGKLPARLAGGSITARALGAFSERSYMVLLIAGAYPLVDYIFRQTPGLTGLAGIWDELLFLLGAALILTRLAFLGETRSFFTPLDLPLLFFLGTGALLYLLRAPEPEVALDGLRATFQYSLWYFLATRLPADLKQARTLLWGLVLVATAVAFYGVYQYIVGVPIPANWVDQAEAGVRTRVFSWIGSPNVLGSYLVLMFPVTAALLITARTLRPKLALGCISLAMLACLVFTFSRGAWLAFLVVTLLYGLLQDRRLLALILAGAVLLPVVSPGVANRIQYTFSGQYVESSQQGGRIGRWEQALDRFLAHPVTGVGLGRFGGATAARYNIPGTFYVDNYYLKLAVETGLLGLTAFLWLLLNAVRYLSGALRELAADPDRRAYACGITAGLLGVLAHNGVENIFEVPMMQTLFWILLGTVAWMVPGGRRQAPGRECFLEASPLPRRAARPASHRLWGNRE
ncbi:MAG: O-antigen ligase family protein [Bacillota bacterium]|nr:O-antigen ligase family protein [Bacillota bacterium]